MTAKQPTVDEFVTDLEHPRVDDIRRIRTGLLAGDAELGERIKWNAPSFGHDSDDRVTLRQRATAAWDIVFPDLLRSGGATDRGRMYQICAKPRNRAAAERLGVSERFVRRSNASTPTLGRPGAIGSSTACRPVAARR